MALLHDASTRTQIEQRIQALTPTTRGRWGQMTVDQMLWHVNQSLSVFVGQVTLGRGGPPLPPGLLRFMVLRLPWMKSAPTHPDLVAKLNYDFEGERARLGRLIEAIVDTPLDGEWPAHPVFGRMTGREISQFMAKHIDHHLKQFGA